MEWPIEHFHHMPGSSSFIEMMRGAKKVVKDCAGAKAGETVVIVSDTNKLRIAEVLGSACIACDANPVIVLITPTGAHGVEPPAAVCNACKATDIYILATTWNLQHTSVRIEALKNGARGTTIPQVTEDLLITGGILADFEECDRIGRSIGSLIEKANEFRVTTPAGTNVSGIIRGRPVIYETGIFRKPGQYAALPDSEINISPEEGTAEGTIICDVRAGSLGVCKDDVFSVKIKDGLIKKIEGGRMAIALNQMLKNFKDETVYNIAEFAIGLNPNARQYTTFLEDEGRLGHGHIGIGSNWAIGGKVRSSIHTDLIFKEASIYLDNRLILEKGNIRI